jgi:hypothetical protein
MRKTCLLTLMFFLCGVSFGVAQSSSEVVGNTVFAEGDERKNRDMGYLNTQRICQHERSKCSSCDCLSLAADEHVCEICVRQYFLRCKPMGAQRCAFYAFCMRFKSSVLRYNKSQRILTP